MAERMVLAEFDTPEALAGAIRELRKKGYRKLDAHTPYSTEVVREALGGRTSRLPFAMFAGGIFGAGAAYFLQWFLVAYLYPLNTGGRPPHMPLAQVPITFEMGVLFSALTGFLGVLLVARLVKLWDPVFEVEGFESASVDKFWLRIDSDDPLFDLDVILADLAPFDANRHTLVDRHGLTVRPELGVRGGPAGEERSGS